MLGDANLHVAQPFDPFSDVQLAVAVTPHADTLRVLTP
jgi:hypothetical protein